ncbi:hypothetical protein K2173_017862 [Erythroxylum novogranatense]|uniref:Uncharacterized protein n=1 Tax=Erythroxylum novogranatense TaxID=1862640 RepID=A0AAV8SLU5_9ROSI|nr:hypothetical protein K2173_017862 [Erythroxylum novogranatense]
MSRMTGSLVFVTWLLAMTTISTEAQKPAVLDTEGRAVRSGVEYYIVPAATDIAGGLTLIDRNNSCPLYVGQEPLAEVVSLGTSVIFTPYAAGETVIRESRDYTITFQAATICIQSTSWRVGQEDPETNRRFVVTAGRASYFTIGKVGTGIYNIAFCPTESCPNCRVRCGNAGILVENGKRLVALDGPAFPFAFRRVRDN